MTASSQHFGFAKSLFAYPPLPPGEVDRLAAQAQAGDKRARDKLILHNLRLCDREATKVIRRDGRLEYADAMQAAIIGVILAADAYDPKRGRFSTIAVHAITQQLNRWQMGNYSLSLGMGQAYDHEHTIFRAHRHLQRTKHIEWPTLQEIADWMGAPVENVRALVRAKQPASSLDRGKLGGRHFEEDSTSLHDRLLSPAVRPVEEEAEESMLMREIRQHLDELPELEQRVLELRFGLGRERPWDLMHTAKVLRISRTEARNLERSGLRRIRDLAGI